MPERNDSEARLSARLEREAFRLAAIVESAEDAIVSKDLDGIIQSWNHGAERIFGYTAEEAIGRPITIVIPDDRLDEEAEVLRRIRAGLAVEHFETVRRRKDGSPIDISLTVSPIRTSTGEIIGASKIARDITEQRRLREIAEEASRLKDEFLALLSHELRTPLNTVLGYARMLRKEDSRMVGDLRVRALDALERNAESLTRLVGDVLDTSRIEAGTFSFRFAEVDLGRLVTDAVATAQVGQDEVQLRADVRPPLPEIRGDGERLRQVLTNLIDNAIKYSPAGAEVEVRAYQEDGLVRIDVRDSGPGIAKDDQKLIFEKFGRVTGSGATRPPRTTSKSTPTFSTPTSNGGR